VVVERHASGVRHRLVEVPDEAGQEGGEVLRRHHHLGMVGAQRASHATGLIELGRAVLGEVSDGEALHPVAAHLAAQVHHVGGDG